MQIKNLKESDYVISFYLLVLFKTEQSINADVLVN